MTESADFLFDGWTLRVSTGELTREGRTQRLTQQPLRILLELLEHPGDVVTRDRLVQLLWPKGVVEFDNGLNVAVRKLRLALGDESETPRYIETLPRLGYRFVGKLEKSETPAAEAVAPARRVHQPSLRASPVWWLAGLALLGIATASGWLMFGSAVSETNRPVPASDALVARRTTSARAYEFYLQGIYNRSRRDVDAIDLAISSFEAALREDPEYAAAWSGLADALTGAAISNRIPTAKAFARGREAASRAVAIDPGIAESHTALGQVYMFYDRDYAAAEAEFSRAREANDGYARLWHHLGLLRIFQGRADEALAAMRRARELEPMTPLYSSSYAMVMFNSRRFDEAINHARGLLEAQPSLDQARSIMIRALVAKGDVASALAQLPLRTREVPSISDAGFVYAHAGEREKALLEVEKIKKLSSEGFGVGYELAIVQAALGDLAAGCAALRLAVRDYSPFLGWLRLDPRMDPLREEPCFKDIERRLGRLELE